MSKLFSAFYLSFARFSSNTLEQLLQFIIALLPLAAFSRNFLHVLCRNISIMRKLGEALKKQLAYFEDSSMREYTNLSQGQSP